MSRRIEYMGFEVRGDSREYALRMRADDSTWHRFTVVIANAAFQARRIRYQDAPDVCFRKLHREVDASEDGMPVARLCVSDDELFRYSAEVSPKRPVRRQRPPIEEDASS